jgi:hypothetical protein
MLLRWPVVSNGQTDLGVPSKVTVDDIANAPSSLPSFPTDDLRDKYHKAMERITSLSEEKEVLKDENIALKRANNTHQLLDELIQPYAEKSFRYMWIYSSLVGAMISLHGFGFSGFELPESVLSYLVGSTAVTVIGLVGMVLTGVFVGARKR